MNELISEIVKKYYHLDESLGSFLISYDDNGNLCLNKDLDNLCRQIFNDIVSCRYLKYKLVNYAKIQQLILPEITIDEIYCLSYKPMINWIDALNIYIINAETDLKGLTVIDNDIFSTIIKTTDFYKYQTAGIILLNVDSNNILSDTIVHEIKHLYTNLYKLKQKLSKSNDPELYLTDSDLQVFDYYYSRLTVKVDFEKETYQDIDKNFSNITYIKAALVRMLYNLNENEKESYKENINNEIRNAVKNGISFNDLYNYCPIVRTYKNIRYILEKLKSKPFIEKLNVPVLLNSFRKVFNQSNGKRFNYTFIVNKFLMKLHVIEKNIEKQYAFWKCYNPD